MAWRRCGNCSTLKLAEHCSSPWQRYYSLRSSCSDWHSSWPTAARQNLPHDASSHTIRDLSGHQCFTKWDERRVARNRAQLHQTRTDGCASCAHACRGGNLVAIFNFLSVLSLARRFGSVPTSRIVGAGIFPDSVLAHDSASHV